MNEIQVEKCCGSCYYHLSQILHKAGLCEHPDTSQFRAKVTFKDEVKNCPYWKEKENGR